MTKKNGETQRGVNNVFRKLKYQELTRKRREKDQKKIKKESKSKKRLEEISQQPARMISLPTRNPQLTQSILESTAETHYDETLAPPFNGSKTPIPIITTYINKKGEYPYITISSKEKVFQPTPCKIELYKTHEARKDKQIRKQLSAIEKTIHEKMYKIREHLLEK